MKNILTKIVYIILGVLLLFSILLLLRNSNLQQQLYEQDNTIKSLVLEKQESHNSILAYRLNIESLKYLNDSVINKLDSLRTQLKIKDKQLLQLQNIKNEIKTKDSIVFRDTIFSDTLIQLDTTLSNQWYTVKVNMLYPNTLKLEASYKSDISVVAYSNKEILGVPKKCFIGRIFQKKYKTIRVEVVDNNPYSEIKNSKFVIIE